MIWFEAVLWVGAAFCLVVALLFFGLLANAIAQIRRDKSHDVMTCGCLRCAQKRRK